MTGWYLVAPPARYVRSWLDGFAPAARLAWLGLAQQLGEDADVREICVGTGKALGKAGADPTAQYNFYVARPRRTGDLHGQAPVLWSVAARLC